ncbi:hypothetical protein BMS3Abin01_00303 [bacterium BMS3Abin01]|nr:hypothetical protein BMS3Abin01_00303 [bacterium BMS3Abin01]
MKYLNRFWLKALLITGLLFLLCAAWAGAADEAGRQLPAGTEDVRLLVDFQGQAVRGQEGPLPPESIETSGSACYTDKGLAVFKEGVNEIIDPGFEGRGWAVADGAAIVSAGGSGSRALQVVGNGSSGTAAQLGEPVAVVDNGRQATTRITGSTRALSYSYVFSDYQGGSVFVEIEASDSDGASVGSGSARLQPGSGGWRQGGIIYDLPQGTASYTVRIRMEGFRGTCLLDSLMSEHKDYFTPFFSGDSEGSLWVEAGAPQNISVDLSRTTLKMLLKGVLMLAVAGLSLAGSLYMFIAGRRGRKHRWFMAAPLVAIPIALLMAIGLGVTTPPDNWPLSWSVQGSRLDPGTTYFYRLTSVDSQGNESPPSVESRIETQWVDRRVVLAWDRDPGAVAYRIYRGADTYAQDLYAEVGGDTTGFVDRGEGLDPGAPPEGPWEDTGLPQGSRSLRPAPDVRVNKDIVSLDTASDYWLAGELELGFENDRAFRPASLFEIGNAQDWSTLAVSLRYVPTWGDEESKILLIKGTERGKADYEARPLPDFKRGSVIDYVVAQLFEPSGGLQAGVHLWYRIDNGEVEHIFVENTDMLSDNHYIVIAKRNYYDYFAINSFYREFAIVQGTVDKDMVDKVLNGEKLADSISSVT